MQKAPLWSTKPGQCPLACVKKPAWSGITPCRTNSLSGLSGEAWWSQVLYLGFPLYNWVTTPQPLTSYSTSSGMTLRPLDLHISGTEARKPCRLSPYSPCTSGNIPWKTTCVEKNLGIKDTWFMSRINFIHWGNHLQPFKFKGDVWQRTISTHGHWNWSPPGAHLGTIILVSCFQSGLLFQVFVVGW